jgi:hypothetical protein
MSMMKPTTKSLKKYGSIKGTRTWQTQTNQRKEVKEGLEWGDENHLLRQPKLLCATQEGDRKVWEEWDETNEEIFKTIVMMTMMMIISTLGRTV